MTFEAVRRNLDRLIEALTSLGYVFDVQSKPQATDWPLELRLSHAIAYVNKHTRKGGKLSGAGLRPASAVWKPAPPGRGPQKKGEEKSTGALAVFDHPALAWVRDEKVVLPSRFIPHPQAPSIRGVDPNTNQELDRLEKLAGGPVPAALKSWFLTCGAVDLRGQHPFLNRKGAFQALHIAPLRQCVDAFENGWLPLTPGDPASAWKVRLPDAADDATLADGRVFSDALRDALHWAGVPGLASAPVKPERELQFVRSQMEKL